MLPNFGMCVGDLDIGNEGGCVLSDDSPNLTLGVLFPLDFEVIVFYFNINFRFKNRKLILISEMGRRH